METIRAAHNLTIELGPTTWRLTNGAADPDSPGQAVTLVEAHEHVIRCAPDFARARHLPDLGTLQPEDVARVIIGWAPESQSWHLGLLLAPRPEPGSKMRWCGLATWPSGPAETHMIEAKLAGQSLARIIERPFYLVPSPRPPSVQMPDTQPLQSTAPIVAQPTLLATPPVALKEPPFAFENWTLEAVPNGLIWQRPTRWMLAIALKIIIFGVIAALFLLMSIGSQTRGFASVDPGWLPLAGLLLGVLMAGLTLQNMRGFFTTRHVLFDTNAREVRGERRWGGSVVWRVPFEQIEYLLLTQTAARSQGHTHRDQPARIAQDVWLHLYDGQQFYELGALGRVEGESHVWESVQANQQPGRRALKLAYYDTPAHHAALVMAEAAETTTWLDLR